MADCIVAEEMLKRHQYAMMDAKDLSSYSKPRDSAEDLLRQLVAGKIVSVWRRGEAPTIDSKELRALQVSTVNALKAVSYAQEVHLELNNLILEEVTKCRTLCVPVDPGRICRQLLSQETQLSFSEPELIWIREDQQPQQMHFTEKGMLKRVVKIVRE